MAGTAGAALRCERAGTVAVLVIDAPPVNALGEAVRSALLAGLAAAAADPAVQAVLIRGDGRGFSAGADIAEFGRPPAGPPLPEVIAALEAMAKPVIAALHGSVLGGGLELALGAHHRVAEAGAVLGFPEVSLGLLPGAGGTQRAPRLIGAARALDLMLTGRPVSAAEACAMGLVDAVVEGDLAASALALSAELGAEAAAGRRPVPTRERRDGMADAAGYLAEVAAARRVAAGRLPAPERIVDCVEAAQLLAFEQGMAFERAAFTELRDSAESAGLRHAFQAERRTARIPEAVPGARPDPAAAELRRAAVIGLGRQGADWALALAGAGVAVTVWAEDGAALAAGLGRIAAEQERQVAEGRLDPAAREAAWARILPAGTGPGDPDLVILALPGTPAALPDLGAPIAGTAVLATASAAPDLAALAAGAGRTGGAIGLRLTLPRLVELAVDAASDPAAVRAGQATARRIGAVAVRVAARPGLVLPRLRAALYRAGDHVLEEGATPAALDAALRSFGFAQGPCEAQDLAEPDCGSGPGSEGWSAPAQDAAETGLGALLRAAGRPRGAGAAGYYRADPEDAPADDPEVLALLAELRRAKGIVPRNLGAEEMRRRCLTALANEGARMLGEGVVLRPSDIDAALVAAGAFPRWEGGPMFWATRRGLLVLRADIRRWADGAPRLWQVAPLIDDLIRRSRSFADLDAA